MNCVETIVQVFLHNNNMLVISKGRGILMLVIMCQRHTVGAKGYGGPFLTWSDFLLLCEPCKLAFMT